MEIEMKSMYPEDRIDDLDMLKEQLYHTRDENKKNCLKKKIANIHEEDYDHRGNDSTR